MNFKGFLLPLVQLSFAGILFCCYAFKNVYTKMVTPVPRHQQTTNGGEKEKATQSLAAVMQWHKTSQHKPNRCPFLRENSSGHFRANKKACNNCLNLLGSSKLVSDNYLDYWQTYFNDKVLQLGKVNVKGKVPEGGNFDFILIAHEPELVLNQLKQLNFTASSITGNTALVRGTLPEPPFDYGFKIAQENGKSQVKNIATVNDN